MKRITSILLALMLIAALTACSSEMPDEKSAVAPAMETAEETVLDEPTDTEEDSPAEEAETKAEPEISFDGITVVDNDECSIMIKEIDPDNLWGYTLKALFENKSADKTYMFSVVSGSINGVLCDPYFATEIAAGKKSNDDISFSDSDLEDAEIGAYTDIELTFRVYDSDDWSADDVVYETVHIYPYGEDKATTFVRESEDTDNILLDNDSVTVIATGYEMDDIWGYTVNLYLVNKTDKTIMFSVDNASVNGYMADPFFAKSVPADTSAFASMSWYTSTLEENDITEVEEIEFELRAYDYDNWLDDDIANEIIVLNP